MPADDKLAYLFPGQGSQKIGMLADLSQDFPIVQKLFAQASELLGYDLWSLTQQGPEEKLNKTEFTQPAMLVADVVGWEVCLSSPNFSQPSYFAGHSLGEYAALVCAGAIEFADAVTLVAKRGELMQNAVPVGVGGMAAIVGLDDQTVSDLCRKAADGVVLAPANYNSLGQTVIAGEYTAVVRAVELAKNFGARTAKLLPVSVPAHCMLMEPVAEELAKLLQTINFYKSLIPVVHNFDVAAHDDPDAIRAVLVKQLYNPVNWVTTIQYFVANGVAKFIECGPGRVIAGLNKRIVREVPTESFINLLDS